MQLSNCLSAQPRTAPCAPFYGRIDANRGLLPFRTRIGHDGRENLLHRSRLNKSGAFDEITALGVQDDGRGPPIVLVSVGKVWPRVLVHPYRDETLSDQFDDCRIGISPLVHHVAPMTPDRFQIEKDELLLSGRTGEEIFRPT